MKTNDQEMTNKELQIWIAGEEKPSAGSGTASLDWQTKRTVISNGMSFYLQRHSAKGWRVVGFIELDFADGFIAAFLFRWRRGCFLRLWRGRGRRKWGVRLPIGRRRLGGLRRVSWFVFDRLGRRLRECPE